MCNGEREREEEAGRTYITDLYLAVSARSRVRDSDKIDLVERQTLKYVSRTYVQIVYTQTVQIQYHTNYCQLFVHPQLVAIVTLRSETHDRSTTPVVCGVKGVEMG